MAGSRLKTLEIFVFSILLFFASFLLLQLLFFFRSQMPLPDMLFFSGALLVPCLIYIVLRKRMYGVVRSWKDLGILFLVLLVFVIVYERVLAVTQLVDITDVVSAGLFFYFQVFSLVLILTIHGMDRLTKVKKSG